MAWRARLAKAKNVAELLTLLGRQGGEPLDAAKAISALHRLASLVPEKDDAARLKLPGHFQADLERHLPWCSGLQLAQQAWALGRLGGPQARTLLARISKHLKTMNVAVVHPAAVASLAHACARLRQGEPAVEFPATAAAACLGRMRPQDAALTLWAAGVLRHRAVLEATPLMASALRRWTPQHAAQALWSFGAANCQPDPATLQGLVEAATRRADLANSQDVANTLWALATLRADSTCCDNYLQQARLLDLRSGQALANSMWALTTLNHPEYLLPLVETALTSRPLVLKPQEWANSLWALAAAGVHHEAFFDFARQQLSQNSGLEELARLSPSGGLLGNVAWSFSLAAQLLGRRGTNTADTAFLSEVRAAMRALGARLDAQAGQAPDEQPEEAKDEDEEPEVGMPEGRNVPHIVSEEGDVVVVYKPAGWEVDGSEWKSGSSALRLSVFLRQALISSRSIMEPSHERGFLHRLDVSSSGLVLHARSFEALLDLRWQQDTHCVTREYLVLVHGHLGPLRQVRTSDVPLVERSGGSAAASNGRPARTLIYPVAWLTNDASNGARSGSFSLLAIRLVTGRRHQIRAQLSSEGHPVVSDARYGRDYLESDLRWCARTFIHRGRLAFTSMADGRLVEARFPLPEELHSALASLHVPSDADLEA
eukprot:TRINITY_DN44070_c0_g1_i1.p1 TRINITY_DN44070_c0_g1~~TRINITY_DN44070_c0_g1_i1.p1  ORF type:complete len:670 (-),score=106.31 TRINITY_DN44070_c0_g1_i1:28-2001(-)